MDITPLFKACVKTLKTRNKALGLDEKDRSSIILGNKRCKTKSDFALKAKDVLSTITKMRDFLLEHRKDYININHLMHGASHMTDSERDKIDSDAQAFMQMCVEVIKTLTAEVKKTANPQLKEHQEAVIAQMDTYLKAVCKIYSGQRAIRVKRAFDKQKMLRLETDVRKRKSLSSEEDPQIKVGKLEDNENRPIQRKESAAETDSICDPIDMEFSPEELQMFEEENQRLYEEMNTLVDEVREIEGRVVEIGRLQEILSEKVLQQEQDVNRVSDMVVGTTENIKEGNEDIREAMKKNAGLRVWILFFLIVMSFSLLFLDWYSP